MSMIRLIPALTLGVFASAAAAQDERCTVPMADWQPRDAVRKMAEAQGWTVARIKIDDGCYEVFATDADGKRFEAAVDPGTLKVIRAEFDDEDEHEHDGAKGEAEGHD